MTEQRLLVEQPRIISDWNEQIESLCLECRKDADGHPNYIERE